MSQKNPLPKRRTPFTIQKTFETQLSALHIRSVFYSVLHIFFVFVFWGLGGVNRTGTTSFHSTCCHTLVMDNRLSPLLRRPPRNLPQKSLGRPTINQTSTTFQFTTYDVIIPVYHHTSPMSLSLSRGWKRVKPNINLVLLFDFCLHQFLKDEWDTMGWMSFSYPSLTPRILAHDVHSTHYSYVRW